MASEIQSKLDENLENSKDLIKSEKIEQSEKSEKPDRIENLNAKCVMLSLPKTVIGIDTFHHSMKE